MSITKRGGIWFWRMGSIGGSVHLKPVCREVLSQQATDALTVAAGVWSTLIVGWLA